MIYFVSILSGFANGLFAAAAGQILIFYLVFILKLESHRARATSIFCISIITIASLIGYVGFTKIDIWKIAIVIIAGIIFGVIGSKFMKKIKSNYLNLISGLLIVGLGIYRIFFK